MHNQLRSDNTASQGVSVREGIKRRLKGAKFKLFFLFLLLAWKGSVTLFHARAIFLFDFLVILKML